MASAGHPTLLEFRHPLKAELERWLVLQDRLNEVLKALDFVIQALASIRFKKRISTEMPPEIEQIRGQYCFAAITYMRCFGSGKRKALRIEDVPGLSAQDLTIHKDIRQLRNHHFAHAVSDDEGREIYLFRPSKMPKPTGFYSNIGIVMLSTSLADVRRFRNLVKKLVRNTITQEREVGDRLAKLVFGPGATWKKLQIKSLD